MPMASCVSQVGAPEAQSFLPSCRALNTKSEKVQMAPSKSHGDAF